MFCTYFVVLWNLNGFHECKSSLLLSIRLSWDIDIIALLSNLCGICFYISRSLVNALAICLIPEAWTSIEHPLLLTCLHDRNRRSIHLTKQSMETCSDIILNIIWKTRPDSAIVLLLSNTLSEMVCKDWTSILRTTLLMYLSTICSLQVKGKIDVLDFLVCTKEKVRKCGSF